MLNEETIKDFNNKGITGILGLINDGKIINRDIDYNQFLYNRLAYLNLYLSIGNELKIKDVALPIVDISSLVSNSILSFNDIFEIRKNKKSIDFRMWIEKPSSSSETRDIVEMYNQANSFGDILNVSREKNHMKTLKFAVPTIVGFIPLVGGYISNLIGTKMYISDMVNNNYKPRIFVESYLKELIDRRKIEYKIRSENDYFIKVYGKISRNYSCPCGSGKKYKKCHGV